MHRAPLTRTQRRTRRANSGRTRGARTLKNRLARNGTPRHGTRCDRRPRLHCGHRTRRRSFIHRTRPGLRNDHARSRRLWRNRRGRRARRDYRRWRLRRRRNRGRHGPRERSDPGNWLGRTRNWRRDLRRSRRCCSHNRSGLLRRRRNHDWFRRRHRFSRNMGSSHWRCSRSGRLCRRRHHCRLCHNWRSRRTHRRRHRFLLLRNRLQHVSRTGNVRQIDLGFDFFFATQRARGLARCRRRFGRSANVGAYFFGFVVLERTGVRLLLGHADDRQHVENRLALDFQFSGEIVDSNLTHPAFLAPFCAMESSQPHGVIFARTRVELFARDMIIRLFWEPKFAPAHALDLPQQHSPRELPLPKRIPSLRRLPLLFQLR